MLKALICIVMVISGNVARARCATVVSGQAFALLKSKLLDSTVGNVYSYRSLRLVGTKHLLEFYGAERSQFLLGLLEIPETQWTATRIESVEKELQLRFSPEDEELANARTILGITKLKAGSPVVPRLHAGDLASFFWPDHGFHHLWDVLHNLQWVRATLPRFEKHSKKYAFAFDHSEGVASWGRYLMGAALIHDVWFANRRTHAEMTLVTGAGLLPEFAERESPFLNWHSRRDWAIPTLTAMLHSKSLIPGKCLKYWRELFMSGGEIDGCRLPASALNYLERSGVKAEIAKFSGEDVIRIEAMAELLRVADTMRPRGPHTDQRPGLVNSAGVPFQIDEDERVFVKIAGPTPFRFYSFQKQIPYVFSQVAVGNPEFQESGEKLQINFPVFYWSPKAMALVAPVVHDPRFLEHLAKPGWLKERAAELSSQFEHAGSILDNVGDILLDYPEFLIEGGRVNFVRAQF